MASAALALARGDLDGGLAGPAAARALDRVEVPGVADWRPMELDALIGLGRFNDAEAALAELEAAIPVSGLPSSSTTAARLSGNLAVARGDIARAEKSFSDAMRLAQDLPMPFLLAQVEGEDGRRRRRAGDRHGAVARLRQARDRAVTVT